jgi:chromosome segregation ATPase
MLGLCCAFAVLAVEPKVSDGGVAIKKAQGLIRQLSQEKMALEAEKSLWLQEKASLENKINAQTETLKNLATLPAEVERYKSGLVNLQASFESQLAQERQSRHTIIEKHNEVVAKANAVNADNQLLVQAVLEREQWISVCSQHNQALQTLNQDILYKYRDKGLLQQVLELEPVTGIGQVETEAAVEDYRYQLKQLQITPYKPSQTHLPSKAAKAEADKSDGLQIVEPPL